MLSKKTGKLGRLHLRSTESFYKIRSIRLGIRASTNNSKY